MVLCSRRVVKFVLIVNFFTSCLGSFSLNDCDLFNIVFYLLSSVPSTAEKSSTGTTVLVTGSSHSVESNSTRKSRNSQLR